MTIRAPLSTAASYGGRKSSRSVASSISATPWSSRYGPVGPEATERAEGRSAVADKVLCRRRRRVGGAQAGSLEARDARRTQVRDELRALAVPLVRPAPADVLGDGDDRAERPPNPGGVHLERGRAAHLLREGRIIRGTEPDVVREDRRAFDVVVPMHGVHAIQHRDAETGPERGLLVRLDHVVPGLRGVGGRDAAAAAEDRPKADLARRRRVDRILLDLGHLADLLVERHFAQQGCDAVLDGPACVHPRTPGLCRPRRRWGRGIR